MYCIWTILQSSETFQWALHRHSGTEGSIARISQKNRHTWLMKNDEILTGNVDGLSTGKMHPGRDQSDQSDQSKLGVWRCLEFQVLATRPGQFMENRWKDGLRKRIIVVICCHLLSSVVICCHLFQLHRMVFSHHVDLPAAISGVSPRRWQSRGHTSILLPDFRSLRQDYAAQLGDICSIRGVKI